MKLLEGKTTLITGAARGIGKAIAMKFAKEGSNIAFTDLAEENVLLQIEKELQQYGIKAKGYNSDASNYSQTETVVNQINAEFGQIDVLINNAGITRDTLLMRMTEEQWDLVINVNLKSALNFTKAVQKFMMQKRSGSIINMSSVVGIHGNAGQANYAASKAGMIGLTKSIALELGSRGIRCNAIAPGFIETEMTSKLSEEVKNKWIESIPLKRVGLPIDVANCALFLASELSSYISGQVIKVCGGMRT